MGTTQDEWTTVRKKSAKLPLQKPKLPPPSKGIEIEDIKADFEKKSRIWKASSCRRQILEMVRKAQFHEGWGLEKSFCLASGSFSRDNLYLRKRSMLQFAAFMDIRDLLFTVENGTDSAIDYNTVQTYAQEPIYTELDNQFLTSIGVRCLYPPEAEEQISRNTFTFAPFLEGRGSTMVAIEAADPIIYIGLAIDTPTGEREYASYKLPEFEEDPTVFEGLVIRWHVSEDE